MLMNAKYYWQGNYKTSSSSALDSQDSAREGLDR